MLQWLRNIGQPRVGESVEVIDGPFTGRTGLITRVRPRTYDVFIDECCRPTLEAAQIRRLKRHSLGRLVRKAHESDPISEEARATTELRDWVDSMGPH
jgi:ribosomal protein L24